MEHLNKPTEKAESLTGSVGKPSAPQNAPQGTEPVIATGGTLSERADKVAKELVENLNRNVTAEGILDEMARRQCAVAPVFPL